MARRLKPVLEAGRERRALAFDDAEEAFRTFFGLVARDIQIRLLLGDRAQLTSAAHRRATRRAATAQFLSPLPGNPEPAAKAGRPTHRKGTATCASITIAMPIST